MSDFGPRYSGFGAVTQSQIRNSVDRSFSLRDINACFLASPHHRMAAGDAWVTVTKSQFDCLRQHCERCPNFHGQLQDLPDGHAAIDEGPPKRRKALYESGYQEASRSLSSSQQPRAQSTCQLSQQPGIQLSSSSSKTRNPKRSAANGSLRQKPRSIEAMERFLQKIPKPTEWRKRQTELELNSVKQYEEVVRAFVNRTTITITVKRQLHQEKDCLENTLVDLTERFAKLTKDSLSNAKCQKSFATFQALILLSLCEVLRKRKVSDEIIDRTIGHIAGERSRNRLLSSAQWINGIIVELVNHGWTMYRATELFFISELFEFLGCDRGLTHLADALSLTNLIDIRNNENRQSILRHFKKDEFVQHNYTDCLRPKYTIPSLIACLLDVGNITADNLSYGIPL